MRKTSLQDYQKLVPIETSQKTLQKDDHQILQED